MLLKNTIMSKPEEKAWPAHHQYGLILKKKYVKLRNKVKGK